MRILHKVFQQTSWQLIGKVVSTVTTVIIFGLLSRSYGESAVGVLTLSLTFLAFLGLAVDFGLNAHFIKRFNQPDFDELWNKLLGLRLIIALVGVVIGLGILAVWPNTQIDFKLASLLGLVLVIQAVIVDSTTAIFQAKLRYDLVMLANVSGVLVTFGLILWLVQLRVGVVGLMVAYNLGWIVTSVVALWLVRKYIGRIWPIFDLSFFWRTIKEIWPIALTLVFNVVYFRIDAFLLSLWWGLDQVGIYNLAYSVFQSALVVPTFVMNSYYPLLLDSLHHNWLKFKQQVWWSMLGMLSVGTAGLVLTWILSGLVIQILAGEGGFVGSESVLRILALSFPAFFGTSIAMWTLFSLGRYKTILWIYLVGLTVNGILNFSYIPHFGFMAAAMNTVICEYLILAIQVFMIIRVFRTHAFNDQH